MKDYLLMEKFGGYRDLMQAPAAFVERMWLIMQAQAAAAESQRQSAEARQKLGLD